MTVLRFQKKILDWFAKNGRHDLPWRPPALKLRRDGTCDPHKVFISEVMLQQTQVDRVIAYYRSFLRAFPNVRRLAAATPAEVLPVWKGLGYNRRALYLKRAAEIIMRDYRGRLPRDVAEIEELPGIGYYTARAICVFAFNQPQVLIETNIRRVFIHFFFSSPVIPSHRRGIPTSTGSLTGVRDDVSDADLLPIIERTLYRKNPRLWYNALMDYGALAFFGIENPNRKSRHYTTQSRFEGSRRYARAKILDFLLEKPATAREIDRYFATDPHLKAYCKSVEEILETLAQEGFVEGRRGWWGIKAASFFIPSR